MGGLELVLQPLLPAWGPAGAELAQQTGTCSCSATGRQLGWEARPRLQPHSACCWCTRPRFGRRPAGTEQKGSGSCSAAGLQLGCTLTRAEHAEHVQFAPKAILAWQEVGDQRGLRKLLWLNQSWRRWASC